MVDHAEVAAQLAVLGADRVEAVRARGDDRPLAHRVPVQGLDVAGREHLEHVVIAHAPCRVAGARLLLAEDRERDAGRVEARRERPRDLPVALVERRRAADPVQDLELVQSLVGRELGDGRDGERQALRPVGPGRRRLAPRVRDALHVPERDVELRREARVLEDEVPAQPDDLVDVLDEHRAGLDARAAGDAVPDGVVRDRVVDDRGEHRLLVDRVGQAERGRRGRVRDEREAVLGLDRHVPDAHDEVLRVERLARVPGRAGLLAAAALGAREAVEQVVPAEVGERPQPERRVFLLEVHLRAARRAARASGSRC